MYIHFDVVWCIPNGYGYTFTVLFALALRLTYIKFGCTILC